jgi:hypothetical protein
MIFARGAFLSPADTASRLAAAFISARSLAAFRPSFAGRAVCWLLLQLPKNPHLARRGRRATELAGASFSAKSLARHANRDGGEKNLEIYASVEWVMPCEASMPVDGGGRGKNFFDIYERIR